MINRQIVSEGEIEDITKNYIDGNTVTLHHAKSDSVNIDKLIKSGTYTFELENTTVVNGLNNFHPQSLQVYSDDYTDTNGYFLPAKVVQILVGWYGTNYDVLHAYIRTCFRENTAEVNWGHWYEIPMLETTNYTSCMSYSHKVTSDTAIDNITSSGIYSFDGSYSYDAVTFNPYNATMIVLGDDSDVGNGTRMSYYVTQILISPDDSGSTNNHSVYMRYGHYIDMAGTVWTDWLNLTTTTPNIVLSANAIFDGSGLASLVVNDGDTTLTAEDIISLSQNSLRNKGLATITACVELPNSAHVVVLTLSGGSTNGDELTFSCVMTVNSNVTYCELTANKTSNTINYSEKSLTVK